MTVSREEFQSLCVKRGVGAGARAVAVDGVVDDLKSSVRRVGGVGWRLSVGRENGCLSAELRAVELPRGIESVDVSLRFATRGLTLSGGELGGIDDANLTEDAQTQPILFNWPFNSVSFFVEVSIKISVRG